MKLPIVLTLLSCLSFKTLAGGTLHEIVDSTCYRYGLRVSVDKFGESVAVNAHFTAMGMRTDQPRGSKFSFFSKIL